MERLQKVIAQAGITSRRKAEQMIVDGRVRVNGKVVKELGTKVSSKDVVSVDEVKVESEEKVYFVINKPSGCLSANRDEEGKDRTLVIDYLKNAGVKERIFPVGRLDYDTTGVLLLTNDGDFANSLMHPRYEVNKTYLARVKGIPQKHELTPLKKGVDIGGFKTAPAKVKVVRVDKKHNSALIELVIHEGKYHQVKRMFESIGYPVKKLRRDRYAFIDVQGITPGDFRPLKPHEVKQLVHLSTHGPDYLNR
ncbi:pseudouridine synthase [Haloplasma contractile]|uniref:Pseudouridine synthase n=1 Tax=Haloplasma contractile SSD-17B TaxID=1033810 RepID=F7PW38_9MOLU|nr:pseudouridine synthase [Haloplasma contractile]ERJ12806.1 Pseudouridine synthase protein [Haloplasma contractile SSD-17B]